MIRDQIDGFYDDEVLANARRAGPAPFSAWGIWCRPHGSRCTLRHLHERVSTTLDNASLLEIAISDVPVSVPSSAEHGKIRHAAYDVAITHHTMFSSSHHVSGDIARTQHAP
jgi:hypothetical protein